jgi:hypothetical protein
MLLALSQPKWSQTIQLAAGADGAGTYRPDPVMGQFVFAIAPTAAFRYDF